MQKWRCSICGYIYNPKIGDPESGVEAGVPFEELADYWGCPDCGADRNLFERCENSEEGLNVD